MTGEVTCTEDTSMLTGTDVSVLFHSTGGDLSLGSVTSLPNLHAVGYRVLYDTGTIFGDLFVKRTGADEFYPEDLPPTAEITVLACNEYGQGMPLVRGRS